MPIFPPVAQLPMLLMMFIPSWQRASKLQRKWSALTYAASMSSATAYRALSRDKAAIIEINAAPGLRMHLQPSFGKGRAVGEAIIANMFKDGDDARIPVVAVQGTNGKTTTVRLIASILNSQGSACRYDQHRWRLY